MRKSELSTSSTAGLPGRLSSSTSSIRARDFSRSYGSSDRSSGYSSASSYRYTPSSSSTASSSLSASTYTPSFSSLSRSPTATPVPYHRALFTSPTTTPQASTSTHRESRASSMAASTYSPLKYSTSAYSTSTLGRDRDRDTHGSSFTSSHLHQSAVNADRSSSSQQAATEQPRAAVRSRSSSVLGSSGYGGSYRHVSVTDYTRQAQERADREREREERIKWEELENERQQSQTYVEPLVKDFRRKAGTGATTMSVTPSGGLGFGPATSFPTSSRYSSHYAGSASSSTSQHSPSNATAAAASSSTVAVPSSSSSSSTAPPSIPPPPPPPPIYESSSTYSATKPMAKVTPYEERGTVVPAGFTGLRNIGNTCFMNATLQMLVNNVELKTYFLEKHHKAEVNNHNPLGFKGRLAEAFADFMHQMWSCTSRAIEPARIKELVAEKASQFANFAQHDAHEFLSFLLDGLHEDVNRVKSKAQTSTVEADGRPDDEVAAEAWRNHLMRNNSIFVDLFHGQLKSRLQCPKCDRVSITFDPFAYLPVPFPKAKKMQTIFFWPLDPFLKPVKMSVGFSPEGTTEELLHAVGDIVGASAKNLRMIEVISHRVHKQFQPDEKTNMLSTGDVLYVFQVHSSSDCHEEIIEMTAVQRLLYPTTLRYVCSTCGESRKELSGCENCYNAYYCNEECQKQDWAASHRDECRRRQATDLVGQPFIVSLPKSKCTHAQLMRVLEARCKHSVDVFMPPVNGSVVEETDKKRRSKSPSVQKSSNGSVSNGHVPNGVQNGGGASNGNGSPPSFMPVSTPPTMQDREKSPTPPPRRQTVLPEQRNGTAALQRAKAEGKMFIVRKVADQTRFHGEDVRELPNDLPLTIASGCVLSINWMNVRQGKPYVNVDSKRQLDIDEERSKKLFSTSGGSSGGDPTLYDMLSMFSETERLKPEESWYCNMCKDHVEATKRLELYRVPPVLIIQLKRFVYTSSIATSHRRSKDERRVTYPLQELDLSSFLANSAVSSQLPPIYDLTGVVCHSGSSYFGHYISMGRLAGFDAANTDIDWRNFDDSIVTKISSGQVQSDDAYLLFYKQRGLATRSIFTRHYSFDPSTVE